MSKAFTKALAASVAPPCTGYSCPKYSDCANEKLACESFVHYVNDGKSVHPLMLFKEMKSGIKPTNILKSHYTPSRKLYDSVFKEQT